MKALIVEDNFISRNFLHKALSKYGEIDVSVDGAEAIEAFSLAHEKGFPYDLILMDIMMPNIDGIEALKRIREIEHNKGIIGKEECKVVMITAVDNPKAVVDAYYKGGATSYVTKPIDIKMLVELVKKLGLIN
jgi:two-component system chemotaxis response regulator CheY